MLSILGAAIASTSAQTQSTTVQVSKLVGTRVKSSQGEEIGVIKDVVTDRSSGCMAYTVLSTGEGGARAAGGGKLVAVPWAVHSLASDVSVLTVTVARSQHTSRGTRGTGINKSRLHSEFYEQSGCEHEASTRLKCCSRPAVSRRFGGVAPPQHGGTAPWLQ